MPIENHTNCNFWLKIDLSGFARNCRRAPLLLLSKVPLYEKKANFYVVLIKGRARKSLPSLHYRSLLETAFVLMNGDDEAVALCYYNFLCSFPDFGAFLSS